MLAAAPTIVALDLGLHLYPSRIAGEPGSWAHGEYLTMSDGAVWFHPDSGAAPVQTKPAKGAN